MITKTNYIKAYEFHGLDFVDAPGDNKRSNCPFCDADGHFYVYTGEKKKDSNGTHVDGMFSCKRCDERGNIYTFLTKLIELSCTQTDDHKYLWDKKRIPSYVSKEFMFCRSVITGEWLIPTVKKNSEGKITVTNIHRWMEGKNKLFGTTGMNVDLLGLDSLSEKKLPLWLCEGHWDRPILHHVLTKCRVRKDYDLLSCPGAGSFKDEWLKYLFNREVYLVFDGDHPKLTKTGKTVQPGLDGMKRIIRMCESLDDDVRPTIKMMDWPEGLSDGYDIRDLFIDCLKKAKK